MLNIIIHNITCIIFITIQVYARTEKEMQNHQNPANASLNYILTLLLDCKKARKYQMPYPLNEVPYGPVQAFFDFKMQLVNQNSAIISTFGGSRISWLIFRILILIKIFFFLKTLQVNANSHYNVTNQ